MMNFLLNMSINNYFVIMAGVYLFAVVVYIVGKVLGWEMPKTDRVFKKQFKALGIVACMVGVALVVVAVKNFIVTSL